MTRNRRTATGVASLVVALALTTWALTSRSSDDPTPTPTTAMATTSVPDVSVVAESPPTTAQSPPSTTATDNGRSDAEPVSHQLRTPVRCAAEGEPKAGPLPGDDPLGAKRWVTVQRLSGACDASSPNFTLLGIDTRLVWRSDAESFFTFLLDSKEGLEATAGYAETDCIGPCSESQALVSPAGTYRLRVQADGGPWEVLIQEYR